MAKKMDPNVKLVNEISKAIAAVSDAADRDPAGLAISKGARSALNRIKSLADAINVPSDADVERIAHERKLAAAALATKAKADKAKTKHKAAKPAKGKRSKAKPAKAKRKSAKGKRSKPKAAEPVGVNSATPPIH